jgi:hypothetical protein
MKREDGLSIIALIIIIVILIIIAGVAVNKLFGDDGVVNQLSEADNEYNKTEIVEKLNLIVKEKYVFDYKYAQENNKKIEEIYTDEIVLNYLVDSGYIEQLKDINDNLVEDQYFINPDSLNSDLATNAIKENGSNGNGTKIYKVKKIDEKYMIYFVDKYGNEEELGELNLKPEV